MTKVVVLLLLLTTLTTTNMVLALAWRTTIPKVLGVCGGIGSGKSSACQVLVEQLGCWDHLDADRIAHSVYAVGSPAISEIVTAFGTSVLHDADDDDDDDTGGRIQGALNRAVLGSIVFSDPAKMKTLEQIVWPYVKQEIIAAIQKKKEEPLANDDKLPIIILEAAVLIDAGWEDLLDGLWVIKVNPETALHRLVDHRGLTKEDAKMRMQAQQSRRGIGNLEEEVKSGIVTKVIDNDDDLATLTIKLREALNDPSAWSR